MENVLSQMNPSETPDEAQVPESALKKVVKKETSWSSEIGADGTFSGERAPTLTSTRQGFMRADPSPAVELEEYFEGVVEEITDSAVQLRTTSSNGEEGVAWLPVESIPRSELKYVTLGAPARISIVVERGRGTNLRKNQIRFLRPSQWRSAVNRDGVTDYLLQKMKAALG